ncbi:MAG: hypothetical protein ACFFD3_02575 [Candidatus Thorarchaeota archaeon]
MSGKPTGILILAILQLISALYYCAIGGLAVIAAAGAGIFGIFFAFAGLLMLIIGIIGLILFYGLWNLKRWAWFWTLIANALGVLAGIMDPIANIIGLAISIIIIIYLFVPDVRAAFR